MLRLHAVRKRGPISHRRAHHLPKPFQRRSDALYPQPDARGAGRTVLRLCPPLSCTSGRAGGAPRGSRFADEGAGFPLRAVPRGTAGAGGGDFPHHPGQEDAAGAGAHRHGQDAGRAVSRAQGHRRGLCGAHFLPHGADDSPPGSIRRAWVAAGQRAARHRTLRTRKGLYSRCSPLPHGNLSPADRVL